MILGQLRVLTAGESHGPQLTIFVQNLPAGLPLLAEDVNVDLARRQRGYGRGGRQQIEKDQVEFVAGVRHGLTMGGPIAMTVKNLDWPNWIGRMDAAPVPDPPPPVTRLRPGHADLAGVVKHGLDDVRNVLERSSARETAARVAAGGVAKAFLRQFGITVRSHVLGIGWAEARTPDHLRVVQSPDDPWWAATEESDVRSGDHAFEEKSIQLIKEARTAGDTLGGVFEVIAYGLPIGLGTYAQWDERLDGRLAAALMSIQSIKGVELGEGFENARRPGSQVHDIINWSAEQRTWERPTNRAGGLEGGVTNGAPLIVRGAAKPISTLIRPLPSTDYATRLPVDAHVERSDVCVLPAAGVVGEAMVALVLADALRIKFGGDGLEEALTNYQSFLASQERTANAAARNGEKQPLQTPARG